MLSACLFTPKRVLAYYVPAEKNGGECADGGVDMLYSVMITVLIAFAVIGIFCGKALRLDKCRRRVKSYIVIPSTCSDRELELLVKGCWWDEVCAGKNCARDIIILFGDGEDFSEQAQLLERQFGLVRCMHTGELGELLKTQ